MSRFAKSTLIVAIFFGLEKVLGFARQILIARQFGLSPAFGPGLQRPNNLPDLLFALISGGALGIAFIPVLSETLQKQDRKAAWDLFSRIANLMFLVTGGIALLLFILADPLVNRVIITGVLSHTATARNGYHAAGPDRHDDLLDQWAGNCRLAGKSALPATRHGAQYV